METSVKPKFDIKAYRKQYRLDHRDRIEETRRIRSRKNPAKRLFSNAKKRAKEINVPFSIEPSDIKVPEYCPILGILLFVGNGKQGANSPSVDRIDSSKGYEKGNVQVISYKANAMKQNATKEELVKFAEWILSGK